MYLKKYAHYSHWRPKAQPNHYCLQRHAAYWQSKPEPRMWTWGPQSPIKADCVPTLRTWVDRLGQKHLESPEGKTHNGPVSRQSLPTWPPTSDPSLSAFPPSETINSAMITFLGCRLVPDGGSGGGGVGADYQSLNCLNLGVRRVSVTRWET